MPENLAYARMDAIKQVLSASWQWTKPGELGGRGRKKNADPMMVRGNGLESEESFAKQLLNRTKKTLPRQGVHCMIEQYGKLESVAGTGVSGDEEMAKGDVEVVERKSAEFVSVERPSISFPKSSLRGVHSA